MGSAEAPIAAGRLMPAEYAENFADVKPPLAAAEALVETSRCHFCYDAPCIEACPTGIDIPGFIRKIGTGNLRGAAVTILEQNVMGGMCARVCPTEVLCEEACVRNAQDRKPVKIGLLQRHATDWLFDHGIQPFTRAPASGKRVAVVGGGPAGLSCAHRLAMLGHAVTVFEARPKLSGLNEYGIAAYKVPGAFAQREVDFILSIGGIETRAGVSLGREVTLEALRREFDAVFLGVGVGGTNPLGVAGDGLSGVEDAVAWIERLRQAEDLAALPVGRRVVVIGGGNTAIDAAVQARRLGAEDVTMVYRRGKETMGATWHEQEFAQVSGVRIRHWARPLRILAEDERVVAIEFERTQLDAGGRLLGTGDRFTVPADQVLKAVGQVLVPAPLAAGTRDVLELAQGKIAVNDDRETSIPGVFAGGDCIAGLDLTVQAVEDGKVAAHAIDRRLRGAMAA
jgi:dihydropyrimidine dehydrogenase (NAD+) subunit PreT